MHKSTFNPASDERTCYEFGKRLTKGPVMKLADTLLIHFDILLDTTGCPAKHVPLLFLEFLGFLGV